MYVVSIYLLVVNYMMFRGGGNYENLVGTKCSYTPSNSEIICVQNVGAKVEMVSYLKK